MTKVFLGLPTYDDMSNAQQHLKIYAARTDNLTLDIKTQKLSALCWNFNKLFAQALNNKTYDFFLLMHADIIPLAPVRWISTLINEADRIGADILSVLSPIKNQDGLTSTGLISDQHPQERRLSMREAMRLPQTMTDADLQKCFGWDAHTGIKLLVNTGLMLCDLRRKRAIFETMCFKTEDRIDKVNGKFEAVFVPEDWHFSMQAHERGLKLASTRAVSISHYGNVYYSNAEAWGAKESDT